MKVLLIYDITEDKLRTKTANMCKDYGLLRVQYSAFFWGNKQKPSWRIDTTVKEFTKRQR